MLHVQDPLILLDYGIASCVHVATQLPKVSLMYLATVIVHL